MENIIAIWACIMGLTAMIWSIREINSTNKERQEFLDKFNQLHKKITKE